jgi:Holliday junction resolvase
MIETYVSTAMPSAKTYQKVMWREEASGRLYENDVVAVIGNTIFLFEAKSGKLDEIARRGGELSLLRNFKELFVDPGEQATRLENYINMKGKDARLWIKDTEETVRLDLERAEDCPQIQHMH